MGKKVYIFLPFSVHFNHARVHLEEQILQKQGYEVQLIGNDGIRESLGHKILNLLCFKYFNWHLIFYFRKHFKEEVKGQNVIFYDLSLLPLSIYFKKGKTRVIYETIDNNVHLIFYNLQKKWKFLKIFKGLFITFFSGLEKRMARKRCDKVIVNSDELARYFALPNVVLNYYASPLEEVQIAELGPEYALLYLGLFDENKGFHETLALSDRLQIPLYVLGKVRPDSLKPEIDKRPLVHYLGKKTVPEMQSELLGLTKRYSFFGVSLIRPVHYSYATQEANKDIDYLALGIPLIGNGRKPTKAKIDAGCGLFVSDVEMLPSHEKYLEFAANAKAYYDQHYRLELFEERLMSCFH
ncbi:MAG: hypothetical protein K0R65_64 [Crocinitomicaceae bacterium]|jgi:hypothetical protein|nr:hypothetical protein [Crocinitomicaceae bacterium]